MVYIVASLLKKAFSKYDKVIESQSDIDKMWKNLMLKPNDYGFLALNNELTRQLMEKVRHQNIIQFVGLPLIVD